MTTKKKTADITISNGKKNDNWKSSLEFYSHLLALKFHDEKHFEAAGALLWSDELRQLPFDLVGNRTILIPAEAESYFGGLRYRSTEVLTPSDLPAQELSDLRKKSGPY